MTCRHTHRIITASLALLVAALCYADTLGAQTTGQPWQVPPQASTSSTYLFDPPNKDGPTVVRAGFQLQDIVEIDDEAETFQFTGVLTLTWRDERQAFDPEKEHTQEKFYQGHYQFNEVSPAWYPEVVLVNESGMYETHGVVLRVQPDGTNTLIQTVSAIAEADFNMRWYPFDTQRLDAVFKVLGLDSNEVIFEADTTPINSAWQKLQISQWELNDIRSSTGEQSASYSGKNGASSTFTVSMEMQRKPFYVIRLVVFPLLVIVILSWSVFWMERSSLGDRISVSFIGILTAVAYQNLVSGIVPHISYFNLLISFVNISFLIMCATVAVNLVVGACDKRGKSLLGDLIDYRCRWIFPLVYFGLLLFSVLMMLVFN